MQCSVVCAPAWQVTGTPARSPARPMQCGFAPRPARLASFSLPVRQGQAPSRVRSGTLCVVQALGASRAQPRSCAVPVCIAPVPHAPQLPLNRLTLPIRAMAKKAAAAPAPKKKAAKK